MMADGTWMAVENDSPLSEATLCARPVASIQYASTTVGVEGCFPTRCGQYLTSGTCTGDHNCKWSNNACVDSDCAANSGKQALCMAASQCYYDVATGSCLVNPTGCSLLAGAQCTQPCRLGGDGKCTAIGCVKYPDAETCLANKDCTIMGNLCTERLCGYITPDECNGDARRCYWLNNKCWPKKCLNNSALGAAACKAEAGCVWTEDGVPQCTTNLCGYSTSTFCNADENCQWFGTECVRNMCNTYTAADCPTSTKRCAIRVSDNTCVRPKCFADTKAKCTEDVDCHWGPKPTLLANGSRVTMDLCTIKSIEQIQASAEDVDQACEEVAKNYGGLIAGLVVLLVLLGVSLAWIYYRQYQKQKAMRIGGGAYGFSNDLDQPLTNSGGGQQDEKFFDQPATDSEVPMQDIERNSTSNKEETGDQATLDAL
jgi:hypothetical protein